MAEIPENIMDILSSVLIQGESSGYYKEFQELCTNISLAYFRSSRMYYPHLSEKQKSEEEQEKHDTAHAVSFISILFAKDDVGRFCVLRKHFGDIENKEYKFLKSKIESIVIKTTQQEMSELLEGLGSDFQPINNAVQEQFRKREAIYKKIFYEKNKNEIKYIMKRTTESEMKVSSIDEEILFNILTGEKFNNFHTTEIVDRIFLICEEHDSSNAVKYKTLIKIIVHLYNIRKYSFLQNKIDKNKKSGVFLEQKEKK